MEGVSRQVKRDDQKWSVSVRSQPLPLHLSTESPQPDSFEIGKLWVTRLSTAGMVCVLNLSKPVSMTYHLHLRLDNRMVLGVLGMFRRFSGRIQPENAVRMHSTQLDALFRFGWTDALLYSQGYGSKDIIGFGGALCTISPGSGDWST